MKHIPPAKSPIVVYSAWVILAILALLPLHAFFTTWLGSNFGRIDIWRAWKELLTVILAVAGLVILVQDQKLRTKTMRSGLVRLVCIYFILALLRTAYGYNANLLTGQSALYGLAGGLRYLTFFLVVWIVANKTGILKRYWQRVVALPATIVIVFGLLQQLVLDKNFLRHFGYAKDTVPPFQAVDMKQDFIRAQSTLRGPNPLGAYLGLVITFMVSRFYRLKNSRFWSGLALISALILLFFTYSRSALIGAAISVLVWLMLNVPKVWAKRLSLLAIATLVVSVAGVFVLRDNDFVQNTVFHTDETSRSRQSSNQARWQAFENGAKDVWHHPLGQGLGSAGPASVRGAHPKLAENYYIQVAQEVGVIGLFVYLAISVGVAWQLFRRRSDQLAGVLFASFIGLSFINLVSHAWMDDTMSMLWWGLAGIALADTAILKGVSNEKKTKKLAQ